MIFFAFGQQYKQAISATSIPFGRPSLGIVSVDLSSLNLVGLTLLRFQIWCRYCRAPFDLSSSSSAYRQYKPIYLPVDQTTRLSCAMASPPVPTVGPPLFCNACCRRTRTIAVLPAAASHAPTNDCRTNYLSCRCPTSFPRVGARATPPPPRCPIFSGGRALRRCLGRRRCGRGRGRSLDSLEARQRPGGR